MSIPLIGPDGRAYEIDDPAGLPGLLTKGFREATAAEPQTLGEKAHAALSDVGDVAEAGASGVLRGATAGLSDVASAALKRSDELPAETAARKQALAGQQRLRESNPIASGLGELAGAVVSPLNKVARAVTGALGATTALGRIGAEAVGQGAVGTLFGAGNAMSDAALGDADLTAERLAASVGLGGLLGAAGGGLGAALSEGFRAVVPKVAGAASKLQGPLEEFADNRWLKAGGAIYSDVKKIPEAERPAVANVIREAMTGDGALPRSLDDAAASVAAERDATAKQLLQHVGVGDGGGLTSKMNQEEAQAAIDRALESNGKRIGEVLKKADASGARPSYSDVIARLDKFESGLNLAERDEIAGDLKKTRGYLLQMGSQPVGTQGFTALNDLKSTIAANAYRGPEGPVGNQLRRQLSGVLRDEIDTQLAPQIGADLSKEFLDAKQAFASLSNAEKALGRKTSTGADAIRSLIDDASLAQPSLAGKLSALDHATNLIAHGTDRKLGNRFFSPSDYLTGIGAGVLHGGPLGALTGIAGAIGNKVLREHGPAVIAKLADGIAKSPKLAVTAQSFAGQLQDLAPMLGKYAPTLLRAASQSPAYALATHMTMARVDPDYAETSKRAGLLPETPEEQAHAGAKGEYLAAMAHTISSQDETIDRKLDAVMRGDKEPRQSKALATQDFGSKRMRRDDAAAHEKRVDEVRSLAANPDALLERLTANLGDTSRMAPAVSAALARHALNAVSFLANESQEPPPPGPMAQKWVAPAADMHKFSQSLEVVQNPMVVLEHAAAGTLTDDQMSALKAVYPRLAEDISTKALERMTAGKDVPYRARLMLSTLTGVDPDGTLGCVISNQQAIGANAQDNENSGMTQGKKGQEFAAAGRMATPSQKRELESANG